MPSCFIGCPIPNLHPFVTNEGVFPDLFSYLDNYESSPEARFGRVSPDYYIIMTHPSAFSSVCTTQLAECHNQWRKFHKRRCHILVMAPDSLYDMGKWVEDAIELSREEYDVVCQMTLVSDVSRKNMMRLGLIDPVIVTSSGRSNISKQQLATCQPPVRGVFIVQRESRSVMGMHQYPPEVGHGLAELFRNIDALEIVRNSEMKLVCPASWTVNRRVLVTPEFHSLTVTNEIITNVEKTFGPTMALEVPSTKRYFVYLNNPEDAYKQARSNRSSTNKSSNGSREESDKSDGPSLEKSPKTQTLKTLQGKIGSMMPKKRVIAIESLSTKQRGLTETPFLSEDEAINNIRLRCSLQKDTSSTGNFNHSKHALPPFGASLEESNCAVNATAPDNTKFNTTNDMAMVTNSNSNPKSKCEETDATAVSIKPHIYAAVLANIDRESDCDSDGRSYDAASDNSNADFNWGHKRPSQWKSNRTRRRNFQNVSAPSTRRISCLVAEELGDSAVDSVSSESSRVNLVNETANGTDLTVASTTNTVGPVQTVEVQEVTSSILNTPAAAASSEFNSGPVTATDKLNNALDGPVAGNTTTHSTSTTIVAHVVNQIQKNKSNDPSSVVNHSSEEEVHQQSPF